jgi:hypothetical protein
MEETAREETGGVSMRNSRGKRSPVRGKQPAASHPDRSATRIQGEGDYEAARRYRQDVEHFVATADIDKAAREAAPRDRRQAAELKAAEAAGRRRAKDGKTRKG